MASIALEYGASEDEAIAALLHDALEDGPGNTGLSAADLRGEIVRAFGDRGGFIAHLVDGATDDTPAGDGVKRPWADRKRAYLSKLVHEDTPSLRVSASDKLHNARTILAVLADTYLGAPAGRDVPRLRALFRELEQTVRELEEACGLTATEVRDLPLLRSLGTPA